MADVAFYSVLVLFLLYKKPAPSPTGTVDIETPTVVGSGSQNLGNTDYQTNLMP